MKLALDIKTLENWLWEAACKIRGEIDAPKFKDFILPIIFLKRLSDVFDDEINKLVESYGNKELALKLIEEDHGLVRFYLPKEARWEHISKLTTDVGENLTTAVKAIARENPKLQGVIDSKDFNETAAGQRVISEDKLKSLIDILGRHRLGLKDVEPDILGRAYEYLLRKFAEGSGQSAGEFYTPREVGILMANILDPEPDVRVYDPCCGSGGLLIKCYLKFKAKNDETKTLKFYGQEILPSTFAMAKMNVFIHDMEADISLGDTMHNPAFTTSDGSLDTFDIVTANPMWNQKFDQPTYENDPFERFSLGFPPTSSADWGWIQHMYSSLNEKGKMAVVLDTGAVSRGSGNQGRNRERDIRKEFIDRDLVESVILLPDNLFYNTSAPGIILVVNRNKKRPNEILLVNASDKFSKGRPKNYIDETTHVPFLSNIYHNWVEEDGVSKIITKEEAIKNDYNLSPSRYVSKSNGNDVLSVEDAYVLVSEAEEERQETDKKLRGVLDKLGLE